MQLIFTTHKVNVDIVSEALTNLGCQAITLEDAEDFSLLEPAPGETPLWPQVKITALFMEHISIEILIHYLEKNLGKEILKNFYIKKVPEKNWVQSTQENFKALMISERLCVCPTWDIINKNNMISVILQPGLAFGTGSHATTQLCLRWLDTHLKPNSTLIDYGCGSGILAISALKLGAKLAYAVDHDPQALQATSENAQRNHINNNILLTYAANMLPNVKVELIIANILAKTLCELAQNFATLLNRNGQVVLSGILSSQQEFVIQTYKRWFDIVDTSKKDEWVLITAIKK